MEQSKYEESILRDEAKRKRKNTWSLVVIVSLLLLVAAFFYFFVWQPQQVIQPDAAVATPAEPLFVPPAADVELGPANTEFVEYPVYITPEPQLLVLDESNDIAIEALGSFYAGDEWLQWMTTDEALRKFVVVIDNIAAGKVAHKYIAIPKPVQKFKVEEKGEKEYFQPASYARYNQYIEIFDSIDVDLMASTYHQFLPLLEQAYAELGYPPEQTFESAFLRALDVMLDTPPLPDGEIELTHSSVVYKYADPELEKLSPVQKQILRMGPHNMAVAREKLRALKLALEG